MSTRLSSDHIGADLKQPFTLASASPRRAELLGQLGHPLLISPAEIEERPHHNESPEAFVLRMSIEKAKAVAHPQSGWVVAGDTVIAFKGDIIGKPQGADHAKEMLEMLSGERHEVLSGWAICSEDGEVASSGISRARVEFYPLSPERIEEYVQTGEPLDKAGSYGIQGLGGRLVSSLEGSFDGVIGAPLEEIARALISLGAIQPATPHLLMNAIEIRQRVKLSAWRSGRSLNAPRLLAVSKRHPPQLIHEAMGYGFSDFGESYLQEWLEKRAHFASRSADETIRTPCWHYIGGIQTNKAKKIGAVADWVHGLSRLGEAQRLSDAAQEAIERGEREDPIRALIQVNLSGEESKGGVAPQEVEPLIEGCEQLSGLTIEGLMTFPPLGDPEENRPIFRRLRSLRDHLKTVERPLSHLSMGTSHDYQVAVEEGATWIRVGRALFGERS